MRGLFWFMRRRRRGGTSHRLHAFASWLRNFFRATADGSAALAGDREPIYNIRYYSDSTYMEQVGFDQGGCSYYGAGYVSHFGQSTPYTDYELIGYCTDGNWEPF